MKQIIYGIIVLVVGLIIGYILRGKEYVETVKTVIERDTTYIQTPPVTVNVPVPTPQIIPTTPQPSSRGDTKELPDPIIVTRDSIVYKDSVVYRDPELDEQVRQYTQSYQDSTLTINLNAIVFGHLLDWNFTYSVNQPVIRETITTTRVFEKKRGISITLNSDNYIIGSEIESYLGIGPELNLSDFRIAYYPTIQVYPIRDESLQNQLIHRISINKSFSL